MRSVAIGIVAFVVFSLSPARADCAAPSVDASVDQGRAGDRVTLLGNSWTDGCDDTGGGTPCDRVASSGDPVQNIQIGFVGPLGTPVGDRTKLILTTLDANDEGMFDAQVKIPDVVPGRYVIRANGSSTPFRVVKGRAGGGGSG